MAEIFNLKNEACYPVEAELANRICAIIKEYEGEISYCSAIGAIEICKAELLKGCMP